jgi:hypothetical protein
MRRPDGADPRDSDRMFDPEVAERVPRERHVTHDEDVDDFQGTSVDTGSDNPSDRDDLTEQDRRDHRELEDFDEFPDA